MTDPSRPVLRLVPGGSGDEPHDDHPPFATVDALASAGPAPRTTTVRGDPATLQAAVDADVDRLADVLGPRSPGLRVRWDAVRRLADPEDLARLARHAGSLHEAADGVRRQHTETAEDLGPLWDTWAGPAAEAVQDRVSALARSAQALVTELESTAGRLLDAHDRVVGALETLADDLSDLLADPAAARTAPAACERAATVAAEAWADARRVLADGGGQPGQPGPDGFSGSGPRCP